jgi:hypothetical protein
MARWVRSYWDAEDVTFLWEVGEDGWVARAVEFVGPERRWRTATPLEEVLRARESGGIAAVREYETTYGVVPEKPIDAWGFPHEDLEQSDFERAWAESRKVLEAPAQSALRHNRPH